MKKCKDCGEVKSLSLFYGVQNECKECTKKRVRENYQKVGNSYDTTERGVIRVIYKTQRRHSRLRGHDQPSYTKQQLKTWLYENGFSDLYKAWIESGMENLLKPSVDRINDNHGYTLDNIRLVTWRENRAKQARDIVAGIGPSGKRCKRVTQTDVHGKFIAEYHSQNEAARKTGISNQCISLCCLGRTKTAGGYIFKFS
jgi:hypothetical protein